jgi:hypothetical protein
MNRLLSDQSGYANFWATDHVLQVTCCTFNNSWARHSLPDHGHIILSSLDAVFLSAYFLGLAPRGCALSGHFSGYPRDGHHSLCKSVLLTNTEFCFSHTNEHIQT